MNIAFVLRLPIDRGEPTAEGLGADVVVGKPGGLKPGAAFHVGRDAALWSQLSGDVKTDYLPDGVSVENGTRWIVAHGARAGKVVYRRGTSEIDDGKLGENPSALKLTYTARSGSFKGSFKVYADNGGRLKATTVGVAGVVVGGVGYGTATIRNVGSTSVEIR